MADYGSFWDGFGAGLINSIVERQKLAEALKAQNDIASLRKERDSLSGDVTKNAISDIGNSVKYKYAIDQQYPDDEKVKALDQLLTGADQLANLKKRYELSDGNSGYQAGIASKSNALRDSLGGSAQRFGLNIGSDVSADNFQNAVDALRAQRNQQATAWANSQNPQPVISEQKKSKVLDQMQQSTDLTNINKDINDRETSLYARRKELGLDSSDPEDQRIAVLNLLRKSNYSPEAIVNGLQYYDAVTQKQKALQDEQLKKQALASVIKTISSTKDQDTVNKALIAYDLMNGGKNAPEYYKAGIPEQVLQTADLGSGTTFSMFNKKGNGSDLRTTVAPNGVKPDTVVNANTRLQMNANDNNTAIARTQIEGDYSLRRAGISYQRAMDVARMSKENKLSPVDKTVVDTVSDALLDPDKWEALNSTEEGQQYLARYRKIAGTGSGKITDEQYDKMYNYYVGSGKSSEEAHKIIQKAYW